MQYQASSKDNPLLAVKKIIKYVSDTTDYGISYIRDTMASLVGYCDAVSARNLEDRKSTSNGCFFLGNNLVSWFSRK